MNNSVNTLTDFLSNKGNFFPDSIKYELFGFDNWNKKMRENEDETMDLFTGLYKALIHHLDVSPKELYRIFTKNKLDDLINIKFSNLPNTGNYYKKLFIDNNVKIGKTCFNFNTEQKNEPQIYKKIQPSYHFMNKKPFTTYFRTIEDSIEHKIKAYKKQDKNRGFLITDNYVDIETCKKLLYKQDNKCYVCCDNVLLYEWHAKCLYQFTLDRIDNTLPHNKDNVLIACFYCNCYSFNDDDSDITLHKMCHNKCHTIKRTRGRNRNDVKKNEISKLKL